MNPWNSEIIEYKCQPAFDLWRWVVSACSLTTGINSRNVVVVGTVDGDSLLLDI